MHKNDCYCTWTFEHFEQFEHFKVNIDKDNYFDEDDDDEHIAIDIGVIEKKINNTSVESEVIEFKLWHKTKFQNFWRIKLIRIFDIAGTLNLVSGFN